MQHGSEQRVSHTFQLREPCKEREALCKTVMGSGVGGLASLEGFLFFLNCIHVKVKNIYIYFLARKPETIL